jgi:peptidyl-prolyl cis-trans isomerase B (cyclophilin B)
MKKPLILFAGVAFLMTLASASGCNEPASNAEKSTSEQAAEAGADAASTQNETQELRNVKVRISTPFGDMIAELFDETPKHRDNFVKLAEEGYYNDLLFHRVIKNFMIQGGDPDSRNAPANMRLGSGGPAYKVDAEIVDNLVHVKGALAAARQGDAVNPKKASSGSQFYIVQGAPVKKEMLLGLEQRRNFGRDSVNFFRYSDEQIEAYATIGGTPHLDGDYTVFGRIIEGLNIIDSIAAVKTMPGDRPVENLAFRVEVIKE